MESIAWQVRREKTLTLSAGLSVLMATMLLAGCGGGDGATSPSTGPNGQQPVVVNPNAGKPADSAMYSSPSTSSPVVAGCQIFPANAIINTRIDDVDHFPIHVSNSAWKTAVDGSGHRRLHLDWGQNENRLLTATYYGIPYNVVDGTISSIWKPVTYPAGNSAPDESDCAVPNVGGGHSLKRGCVNVAQAQLPVLASDSANQATDAAIEGGQCQTGSACAGDRHILVLDKSTCHLWEAGVALETSPGHWSVYASAAWNLKTLDQRPANWTSADAAGLPIFPLLVRVDEANAGAINHALRMTLRNGVMGRKYDWPARHQAGISSAPIPFGALLRLRAGFVVPASWTTQAKAIATALQRYGAYVADNGSDLFIQGEPSAQWNDATFDQLQTIPWSEFEFVSLEKIKTRPGFNPDSLAATW